MDWNYLFIFIDSSRQNRIEKKHLTQIIWKFKGDIVCRTVLEALPKGQDGKKESCDIITQNNYSEKERIGPAKNVPLTHQDIEGTIYRQIHTERDYMQIFVLNKIKNNILTWITINQENVRFEPVYTYASTCMVISMMKEKDIKNRQQCRRYRP